MLDFQLFRVKVLFRSQMPLLAARPDRPEIVKRVISSLPSAEFRKGMVWHVGNVDEIDANGFYFRVGRVDQLDPYSFQSWFSSDQAYCRNSSSRPASSALYQFQSRGDSPLTIVRL